MIKTYVVFDLETTGLSCEDHEIIEIGALKVRDGKVVDRFMAFNQPKEPITPKITEITGISNEMVKGSREESLIIKDFIDFSEGFLLIGHNIMFDYKFMKQYAVKYGHPFEHQGIDTLKIARMVHKDLESKSLGHLCEHYGIDNQNAHRAYHDALATAKLYQTLGHYFAKSYPKLFEPEMLQYKPKKKQPITAKQKTYLSQLLQLHSVELEEDINQLTRSEASRLINQYAG